MVYYEFFIYLFTQRTSNEIQKERKKYKRFREKMPIRFVCLCLLKHYGDEQEAQRQ